MNREATRLGVDKKYFGFKNQKKQQSVILPILHKCCGYKGLCNSLNFANNALFGHLNLKMAFNWADQDLIRTFRFWLDRPEYLA